MDSNRVISIGVVLLCAASLSSCGSDSTAPGPNGLSIAGGAGQSDTVLSTLPKPLIMRLQEPGTRSGQIVNFFSLPIDIQGYANAYVHRVGGAGTYTFLFDSTDLNGRAAVQVVFGTQAGPVPIIVEAPVFNLVDTVWFTVRPGSAAAVVAAPEDTALFVGATLTLHTRVVDRFGNARTDPVAYSVLHGPATIADSVVTGTAVGRAAILASAGGKSDTTYLSVVPQGVLAAGAADGLHVFHLDGSAMQQMIIEGSIGALRWSPSGTALVYDQTTSGQTLGTDLIQTVTLSGTTTVVDQTPADRDIWPQWSRDGGTIFYSKLSFGSSALWAATPTGYEDDSLPNQNPSFDLFPSPSPDATQLVYVADLGTTADLRILTRATGAVRDLNTVGWAPVWAPTGQTIAYISQFNNYGPIALINADGTGQRQLAAGPYNQDLDWSPDEQWIVAQNTTTTQIDLINVATGAAVPLPYTTGFWSPAWQPTSGSGAGARVRHARPSP